MTLTRAFCLIHSLRDKYTPTHKLFLQMHRAKRDYGSATMPDHRQRKGSQRPAMSPRNAKRQRVNDVTHATMIASSDKYAQQGRSSQSLSDIKRELRSDMWLWDRPARGYEKVNVRVLKLFNVVQAGTSIGSLPDQLQPLKNIKEIRPENSHIFLTLKEDGKEKLYPDIVACSRQVAKLNGNLDRPHLLPNMKLEPGPFSTLVNPHAIIVYNSPDTISQRYSAKIQSSFPLDSEITVVTFVESVEPRSPDIPLFTSAHPQAPTIEIFNAFPRGPSNLNSESTVKEMLQKMCLDLNSGPVEQMNVENNKVNIILEDTMRTEEVARRLGEVSLQGRPLVTTVKHIY